MHFVPKCYINDVIIPATNANTAAHKQVWCPATLDELMHEFERIHGMEVYNIKQRRLN